MKSSISPYRIGKLSLSLEPVELIDVMHECQDMIEPQAQQRDITDLIPFDASWCASPIEPV